MFSGSSRKYCRDKSSRNLHVMCKKTDRFSFLCLAIHHFRVRRKGVWWFFFKFWSLIFYREKNIIVNYPGFCYSCWYFQTLKVSLIGLGFLREDSNNLTTELQSQEFSKGCSMSDRSIQPSTISDNKLTSEACERMLEQGQHLVIPLQPPTFCRCWASVCI